ncbi:MAG: glycosyltransferase family 2 protein [bacterium]
MGVEETAPELTVLVPVYNEAGNLSELAEEIGAALDGVVRYELLFIDDGSGDGSAEELAVLKAARPDVRLVRHSRRSGKSAALWTGLKAARAPWIQTLDGDGQNDPADAARAWRWLHSGEAPERVGIIAGQRTSRNDGGFKWLQSRTANTIRRVLLNDGTRDTGCGFKLIRTEAFRDVPFFDGMHRFLPALVRRAGWEVAVLPVSDRPRGQGKSKYGFLGRLSAGVVDLMGVVWLMRRSRFPPERSGDL